MVAHPQMIPHATAQLWTLAVINHCVMIVISLMASKL